MTLNGTAPTGEACKEAVAIRLMLLIAKAEGIELGIKNAIPIRPWILDTYQKCLSLVNGETATGADIPDQHPPVDQPSNQPAADHLSSQEPHVPLKWI